MRITREILLKIIRDTVAQRTRSDRSLLAVYLTGTVLGDDFMLGGAADLDLVFIHTDQVESQREIVRITDEIHLDISHHYHRDYRQPRLLRVHPWQGPTIKDCVALYDPQHFIDFTQASVRGQFDRPDYILQRARVQAEHARQMWTGLQMGEAEAGPQQTGLYLKTLDHAANSIASLSGPPLTERRMLVGFPARAEAAGRAGLHAGLLGLLGAPHITPEEARAWLPDWQAAYEAAAESGDPRLHPARQSYYRLGIEALLKGPQPLAAVWPLLRTWAAAIQALPADSPARPAWESAFARLGLAGDGIHDRITALDAYLDLVEETLDAWAARNGA
jgi:hypothetical protein